jgi:anaerobic ribonucleoside-triphosphate reductase activating protein
MNAAPPLFRTTPARLAEWCLSIGDIDGITLSGGDPFDQPLDQLAEFLELIRERSGLSVLLYTGRTLSQLRCANEPLVERCLAAVDILVDGPYVEALNDGVGWRGSSNQVIHAIGPRAGDVVHAAMTSRRVELVVNNSGLVSFTGIPRRGVGARLAERLERGSAENDHEEKK